MQWWFLVPILALILFVGIRFLGPRFRSEANSVIVYCAQDQGYAETIFADFQRLTGLRVRAVFDSEAVKTVGLANRLLAEQANPQADVFWGNEELRTRQLAAHGVFRPTNGWRAFGFRSRRLVINTNFVATSAPQETAAGSPASPTRSTEPDARPSARIPPPRSLLELTNARWQGKVALAYPLFGTTATHFLALRQQWGQARWLDWCRALQANHPLVVDGNSVVVRLVGKGEAWVGLTDSDDIAAGQRAGYPIAALPLTEESLLIPNTVGIVHRARHPDAAQRLSDYLVSHAVVERLVAAGALEGASPASVSTPTLQPDWTALVDDLDAATESLKAIFLR
jgi:iron(III) transport system substrate-binding protein